MQTGFIDYDAERVNNQFGEVQRTGDLDAVRRSPLLQIKVNISCIHRPDCNEVALEVIDGAVKVLNEQFNNYLPVDEYDQLFSYVTNLETEDKNVLPIKRGVLDELWSEIVFRLRKNSIANVSDKIDLSQSKLALVARSNYFLTEDLSKLAKMSEEELARINAIQANVLESASRLVKAGGRLVYATCSLLKEENQGVVEAFLAKHPEYEIMDATDVLAKQGVELPQCAKAHAPYFVMAPQQSGTDGFLSE